MFIAVQKFIITVIDAFYPPFSKIFDKQTFRYAACGGGNMVLDICLYYLTFHFVLKEQVLHLGFMAFEPHTAAFFLSFIVTFPVGFLLMRFVVFTDTNLRRRQSLVRYMLIVAMNILINYLLIKLMVEQWHFYPTIAKIITTILVVVLSFLLQRKFAFKA
jgi:putative flippase GtrA